jgi:hypothetical protein
MIIFSKYVQKRSCTSVHNVIVIYLLYLHLIFWPCYKYEPNMACMRFSVPSGPLLQNSESAKHAWQPPQVCCTMFYATVWILRINHPKCRIESAWMCCSRFRTKCFEMKWQCWSITRVTSMTTFLFLLRFHLSFLYSFNVTWRRHLLSSTSSDSLGL